MKIYLILCLAVKVRVCFFRVVEMVFNDIYKRISHSLTGKNTGNCHKTERW
ncbi:MAG: hypothetical protein XD77_0744 [Marinimicrobia bacterium 46_47]|nr:MAG: hypothetical protein XD77_0744 [Marinimicrobia bacterium 46_47]KUK89475.1 MAG: hypothetical protein XE04_1794 [Marinimicrobia bacterium 46_43]